MRTVGVFNIITVNQKVLLVKRADLPLWDLPGGTLEKDETVLNCLTRETLEETGLTAKPLRRVGTFINQELDDEQIVYCSEIIKGTPQGSSAEVKQIKFISVNHLPINLVPHRKKQIHLALTNRKEQVINVRDSTIVKLFKKRH